MIGGPHEELVDLVEIADAGAPTEVSPDRLPGPAPRPPWWPEASAASRAVALGAALALVLAGGSVAAAARARHPQVARTRTVLAPPPVPVDALGCPTTRTCRIVDAPAAAAAVHEAGIASATGQMVLDTQAPATVYARTVHAAGTFNHAPAHLWAVATCGGLRSPGAAASKPTSRMIVTGILLTQSYTQRYDGDCAVTVWSRYAVEFTSGGYPEPSQEVMQLVETLAIDPRIRL